MTILGFDGIKRLTTGQRVRVAFNGSDGHEPREYEVRVDDAGNVDIYTLFKRQEIRQTWAGRLYSVGEETWRLRPLDDVVLVEPPAEQGMLGRVQHAGARTKQAVRAASRAGHQEHGAVLRAAGIPTEGCGGEHGVIMDAILGHHS